jgi:hypothetical protein
LNHFEKCKIFLSIFAVINWISWTCARDFNSAFQLSNKTYIFLIANFLLDFISKVTSLNFNLYFSTLIKPSTNLFIASNVIDSFDQWSFMKCYFVGHLWQLVKGNYGTFFSSSSFDDEIVNA